MDNNPRTTTWTLDLVKRVCRHIEDGLCLKDACHAEKVPAAPLTEKICGEDPDKPVWKGFVRSAQARLTKKWIQKIEQYADDGNNAGVEAAKNMLFAFDQRFGRQNGSGGASITLQVNSTEAPRAVEAEVVDIQGNEDAKLLEDG